MKPVRVNLRDYPQDEPVSDYKVLLHYLTTTSLLKSKVPHAGLDKLQLEDNIRQSNVLNQPSCCPGSIYNMMLTCWSMSAAQRLTFGDIASQLVGTLSDIQKMVATFGPAGIGGIGMFVWRSAPGNRIEVRIAAQRKNYSHESTIGARRKGQGAGDGLALGARSMGRVNNCELGDEELGPFSQGYNVE
ncbi:hypothetical protein BSL78_21849 [Apostichopus japonicus]|uniref:Serine-threonine/tyrosine-protein kinase catalytic domain-containing protein n=1 Tax=Stichopus japonicus TaxID=307972 RepID=A0A2G8JZY3_STIJA|nr:hypothetical protein BSL78_21849 [Apostichopus japonicus]